MEHRHAPSFIYDLWLLLLYKVEVECGSQNRRYLQRKIAHLLLWENPEPGARVSWSTLDSSFGLLCYSTLLSIPELVRILPTNGSFLVSIKQIGVCLYCIQSKWLQIHGLLPPYIPTPICTLTWDVTWGRRNSPFETRLKALVPAGKLYEEPHVNTHVTKYFTTDSVLSCDV